ncbi:nitronate monooxygenase [Streptomyces flaveolus]|uniref:nitronate monooxygenase n=1 Tax=Streptomyces flaveolus TaxID=67297 RepID=UPI0036FA00B4
MPEPLRRALHQLLSEAVANCQEVLRYTEPDQAHTGKRMMRPGQHAAETGADLLIVQAPPPAATPPPSPPTFPPAPIEPPDPVSDVRHTVALPVIAAGGITTPADTATALRAGAHAVMVGTALLRTHESGASAPHEAALDEPAFTDTTVPAPSPDARPAPFATASPTPSPTPSSGPRGRQGRSPRGPWCRGRWARTGFRGSSRSGSR